MTYAIRSVEERDAPDVHSILLSEHVLVGTMRLPIQDPAYTAKRLAPEPGAHKMVATHEDIIVGYAELITAPLIPRHAHAGELNMIFTHPDWQGKGVADSLVAAITDLADNWINLRRLSLVVWTDNTRAIALYQRHGFEKEGVMREYAYRKGSYVDAMMMGRLRPAG